MKCQEIQKLLTAYLSGEMAEIQRTRVKRHLAVCENCAEILKEEQALDSLLDQWELELPVIDISQNLMEKLETPKVFVRRPRQLTIVTDLVAAAAAVLLVFFSSFALVDEIPKSIGHWSQQYLNVSLDTVDTLYEYLEDFRFLKEEILDE